MENISNLDLSGSNQSTVEIRVSCKNLPNLDVFSKSDPQCILYYRQDSRWVEFGRTEMIWDNLNPQFVTPLIVDYRFEAEQHLKFLIVDIDDPNSAELDTQDVIGYIETTLGTILSARSRTISRNLIPLPNTKAAKHKDCGVIKIVAEELAECRQVVKLKFSGFNLKFKKTLGFLGNCDPFFRIARSSEEGSYLNVYESSFLKGVSSNVQWPAFQVNLSALCNRDPLRSLRVEVWHHKKNGDHTLIGRAETSLKSLLELSRNETQQQQDGSVSSKLRELNLVNPEKANESTGVLVVNQCVVDYVHTFLEFIAGGMQISLAVGIDFTSSNGNPRNDNSLHYINPSGELNEYQKAIHAVGNVLETYDTDKKYPVYGFGGKLLSDEVAHCFPLNGQIDNPEVQGVNGILAAYRSAISNVRLAGPTYFSVLINHLCDHIEQELKLNDGAVLNYHVLLILTDGVINDMEETVRAVIRGSHLPLSIVIVGVGEADFSNMHILDADENPLKADGVTQDRDIVQFVPFHLFSGIDQHKKLAEEVLAEIPDQFLNYMRKRKISPHPPPTYEPEAVSRSQGLAPS
ncbi:Copine-domain-containing protein [Paraphysoderma sedebokerense]|nr:Copine-domain-containing protein [Paraphysoderma sedebokerense]